MTIRTMWDTSLRLMQVDDFDAALTIGLVAMAGAARVSHPAVGDRDAFTSYLREHVPVSQLMVVYRGKQIALPHLLYKHVRCALVHEANLSDGIEFVKDEYQVSVGGGQGKIVIGQGLLSEILEAIANDRNVYRQFSDLVPYPLPDIKSVKGGNIKEILDNYDKSNGITWARLFDLITVLQGYGWEKYFSHTREAGFELWNNTIAPKLSSYASQPRIMGLVTSGWTANPKPIAILSDDGRYQLTVVGEGALDMFRRELRAVPYE